MNLKLNKGKVTKINHIKIDHIDQDDDLIDASVTDSDEDVYAFLIDPYIGKNEDLELPFDVARLQDYYIALCKTFDTFGQSTLGLRSYSEIKQAVESLSSSCVQRRAFKTVAETYIKQIDLFILHLFNDQLLEDLVYHIEPWSDSQVLIEFESYAFEEYQITQDIKTDKAVRAHFEGSREIR